MHTPITAFYAALLAILFFYLSSLVIQNRRSKKIALGDGGDKHFQQFIRAHANFNEYVPIVLILLLIAELNGTHPALLHLSGLCMFIGRGLHSFGLCNHSGPSWQRVVGMLCTFGSLLLLAALNLLILY
ncbi:MAG: putative membrane protein YecN with MAPEG domain [Paraglaciecola sp.]|jgi:uncharacterized membrane protein YecN with MAPEG domain